MDETKTKLCPKCFRINDGYAIECQVCGIFFEAYEEAQRKNASGNGLQSINCSACGSNKSMSPTEIHIFDGIVRFIGYLIVIPSIIGVVIAAMFFFSTCSTASSTLIGYSFAVFIAAISLISGLVGWLLIMKKKVFKCISCGFILNRN